MLRLFPRPQPPRTGETRCWCACHRAEDGPPAINGLTVPGVDRTDEFAAVTACPLCLAGHAVALSGHGPAPLQLAAWAAPYRARQADAAPAPVAAVQADGGDDGN